MNNLGDDSLIWAKVQPELSKTTRVCSYDRAGFGWSEPQPGPRDADRYPHNLSALVFVDDTPLQQERFPNELREEDNNAEREFMKLKWLEILGIARAQGQCKHFEGFDDFTGRMIAENQCRASQLTAMRKEHQSLSRLLKNRAEPAISVLV